MSDTDVHLAQFVVWLKDNGAKFTNIDWPSENTTSGVRGAVAVNDIKTNEPMIEIPIHLMMSPPIIFRDPEVGNKLQCSMDLLHGDLLLSVYIMHERRKGESSFYFPYLRILPKPGNVSEWGTDELHDLQVSYTLFQLGHLDAK